MKQDTITITILEDGTIKTETDKVSAANHSSAEAFLRGIIELAGGPVDRKAKRGATTHTHAGITHSH